MLFEGFWNEFDNVLLKYLEGTKDTQVRVWGLFEVDIHKTLNELLMT
jgi:hypothetical protein